LAEPIWKSKSMKNNIYGNENRGSAKKRGTPRTPHGTREVECRYFSG